MKLLSKVFRPTDSVLLKTKSKLGSKSHALLTDLGFIKPACNGTFYLLPLFQKSLEKCINLVDAYMNKLNAQKITIPILTTTDLWKKSGRYEKFRSELLVLKDRHNKDYILGPTYEESITELLATVDQIPYKELPLRLYQIGNKYRDEASPRYGLIRSREFVMKDMYTFDVDKESAQKTYEEVNDIYAKLLQKVSVPYVKVEADASEMGGCQSHEYHYLAEIGDEVISQCLNCNYTKKHDANAMQQDCPNCEGTLTNNNGIEIGHTFYLGDFYSKIQNAHYLHLNGKPRRLEMGCHGIGVTRIIAAAIETLSSETEIRWPFAFAPYSVCIIPPKKNSKEESLTMQFLETMHRQLSDIKELDNSIIVDDRTKFTIGRRFMEAKRLGFPLIIVIGAKAANVDNELFELHFTNTGVTCELSLNDLITEVNNFVKKKQI